MPRGYRSVLVALVGWLVLSAAAEPQNVASPEQAAAEQATAKALGNIAATYDKQAKQAERSRETEPCESGDDKRYSDLCAQWKAADSASLAAWLSGIGLIGVALALGLNAQSNWIASNTARQQLRAYIAIKHMGYFGIGNDGLDATYSIVFVNAGQTPAYDYRGKTKGYIAPKDHEPQPLPIEELRELVPDICGAGYEKGAYAKPLDITPSERAGKIAGTHRVFVVSGSEYRDTFGRYYRMETASKSRPDVAVSLAPVFSREYRIRGPNWRWWHLWNRYPD